MKTQILSSSVAAFTYFVEKKNKVAQKLGCAPIKFEISNPRMETRERLTLGVVDVTIDESQIKLGDYTIAGRIDSIEGSVVTTSFGSDMKKYRNVSMTRCDHCNQARRRSQLFVLNDGSDEKVVGSSCLVDFTGHSTAAQLARAYAWVAEIQDIVDSEEWNCGSAKNDNIENEYLLSMTAAVVRLNGYISRIKADERQCSSTKDQVLDALFSRESTVRATEEDKAKAVAMIEWFNSTEHEDSEYFSNMAVFINKGYTPVKFLGITLSLIAWYDGAMRKAAAPTVPSEYIGEVGQKKVTLSVKVIRAIPMGQFCYGAAATVMYMMKAGDNMIQYVTGQDFKEGEEYTLQATIKAHAEYKGTKETVITRAKLI